MDRSSLLSLPVRRPLPTLAAGLGLSLLLGLVAARVPFDNAADAWLPAGDPERAVYDAFRARFGADAFVLVGTGLDAGDPAAAETLLRLAERLRALEGVARVDAPVASGTLVEQARAALPGLLAAVDRAAEGAPDSRQLALLQAELHAARPFALHLDDPQAAVPSYRAAQRAALRVLRQLDPALPRALEASQPPIAALVAGREAQALPALFWWAFARGAELRAGRIEAAQLFSLGRLDEVMRWVLQREEGFWQGGAHLYWGMRLTLPRAYGGDPGTAMGHFEAVRRLRPDALLPRVIQAELLAPTHAATPAGAGREQVLLATRAAWEALVFPLREVLAAPPDPEAPDPVGDAVARERAAALLQDPSLAGVPTPPDAPALSPVTPPRGPSPALDPLGRRLRAPGHAALLVTPAPALGPGQRAALVARIEALLAGQDQLGPVHLAGPDVITRELDLATQQGFGGLFPLVLLAMVAVLYGALGSLRAAGAVLLAAAAAAIGTLGLLSLAGQALNLLAVTIPAVVAVIASTYSLHLVSRYLDGEALGPDAPLERRAAAWEAAARATFLPCWFAALTTALGFASLIPTSIPPVRELGIFAGLGTLLALLASYALVPAALVLSRRVLPGPAVARWWDAARARAAAEALRRHQHPVLLGGLVLAFLAAFGLGQLRVESHVLRFFPPSHRLPRAFEELEPALFGLTPLELWLEGPAGEVLSPAALDGLDELIRLSRQDDPPLVTHALSPLLDLEAELPGVERAALGAVLVGASQGAPDPRLAAYLGREGPRLHLRVTLACRTTSSDEFHQLVQALRAAAPSRLPPAVTLHVTGSVPLLVRVQLLLVQTQLSSFALSFLLVGAAVWLQVRSLALALLSLVPSLLPILVTLGVMGWSGISLNTATVTVAGIALGLVIDDTIHFLHCWEAARRAGHGPVEALAGVLSRVGRPIVSTSAALALGFGVFALSSFRPTLFFGLLIAVTALAALVCVLLLLPALLLLLQGRRARTPGPRPG